MADSSIQLPPDSTGKLVRTQTVVVSGATVHQHYMIPVHSAASQLFPAPQAGIDNFPNPTTVPVHGMNYGFDGTNWDRITKTDESSKSSLDTHLTNATIEKTVGSAIGTLVLLQGISDGTNAQAVRGDTSGRLQVLGIYSDNSTNATGDKVAVLPVTANTSDPSWTSGNRVPLSADLSGYQRIRQKAPSSGTIYSFSGAATTRQLLASNVNRLGGSVFNDSTATFYMKFGATASPQSFKMKLAGGGSFVFPFPIYTGVVAGFSASAAGSIRVSEET